ncbi:hypothetical protein [Corynebacterium nasicanis]|uniref:Uncharacterized protein n=1 Tax=Corynebacterium nasicanis TaxID=1448267 RepID=A0ABW1QC13_9CORY
MTTTPDLLARAMSWGPDDETLSSGEAALSRIVHAITADVGALDGSQLTQLARWLTAVATETRDAEQAGLQALGVIVEPDFS